MKKRVSELNQKRKRILNKLGMTYVELICALSLLSLIVVMFTPMLLSSYESLYKAGETVEKVYDSKEEIEGGLASRISVKTVTFETFNLGLNNLQTNADVLFKAINVNGKKVVSSFAQGLETVFGNARASVDIISPKIVYDDKSNHDVMIQTSGIEYSLVRYGSYSGKYGTVQETADEKFLAEHKANIAAGGKGVIFIEVIIPDKTVSSEGATANEENVYLAKNIANLKLYSVENQNVTTGSMSTSGEFKMLNTDNHGRIKFNISGRTGTPLDFTQSPIKINVYYINPREQVREVADYLVIDPPTMMFAGETKSDADYYTSAGVTEKDGVYSLEVEARKMRLNNSGYLTVNTDEPNKKGATIQTISWVQNDENSNLKPYYVMAGTNSSVFRMYNFSKPTSINTVFGITGAKSTNEGSFIRSDGAIANPSFWSGEMSDQYYFKTLEHSSGYGAGEYVGSDCSQAQSDNNGYDRDHTGSRYNYFDKTLRYMMQFNGFTTGYNYQHLANRRISYVLTEAAAGRSFRFGGRLRDGEFSDYSEPWEPADSRYVGKGTKIKWDWFTIFGAEIVTGTRIVGGDGQVSKNVPYEGPVYFYTYPADELFGIAGGSENVHFDRHFAYLRLKSYVSVDPVAATIANNADFKDRFNKGDFWWPYGYNETRDKDNSITNQYPNNHDWISQDTANSVNVTSSAFLPGSGSGGQGQVIYFGTVPAYAFIQQASDIDTNSEPDARHVYNGKNIKASRATGYVVSGTQGNGTTIYRYFSKESQTIDSVSDYFVDLCINNFDNIDSKLREENNRYTFYTYHLGDTALNYNDSDLEFTFGYCSRWRMAVGDVTYNGKNESSRSYEKYYVASNPNASYKLTRGQINTQDENNLYYNVWFPGEYYNLTHVATLDEITVACGYAVSGSSFMKESVAWPNYGESGGFYGTALGSIYNDGVLAAYISEEAGGKVFKDGVDGVELTDKGDRNVIFQNILYYKSPTFTDRTLHSRESVRFTAVDLISFTDKDGKKIYQAVFGDNHGKLYCAEIAESKVENTSGEEEGGVESNVQLKQITYDSMTELTYDDKNPAAIVGTNSLSTIFSEITSIEASEDMVIVTGPAKNGGIEQFAVFVRPDPTKNDWTMKRVSNGTFTGVVNNAMILGEYYYITGDGWVAAVSLETLKSLPAGGTIKNKTESLSASPKETGTSTNKDHLLWVGKTTNDVTLSKIYALDGRLTEG